MVDRNDGIALLEAARLPSVDKWFTCMQQWVREIPTCNIGWLLTISELASERDATEFWLRSDETRYGIPDDSI